MTTSGPPSGRVVLAVDPVTVARLHAELARLDDLSNRLDAVVMSDDPAESAAAVDKVDELRAMAYDLSAVYLRAAFDHLHAWRSLLHAGIRPAFAHLSLLRTAHECAYFALWLTEPDIDRDERRARGVAAQFADYDERRKVEQAVGMDAAKLPSKLASQRQDDLLQRAQRLGMTQVNRQGRTVLALTMPSAVTLFDLYEPASPEARGSFLYRLYSGYAHGKQWALLMGAQRVGQFDDSGRARALVTGGDTASLTATARAIAATGRAVTAYETLHQPPT